MPASGWRAGVSSARAARCLWSCSGNHKSVSRAHRLRLCAAGGTDLAPSGLRAAGCPPRPVGSARGGASRPAHPDAEAVAVPRYLDIVRQPGDHGEAELRG